MPTSFEDSYVGRLRALVGDRLLKLPGAVVLIEDDRGRILLERSHRASIYRLVGGLAEERESMEQCARREVAEETGLTLGHLVPYGFCDGPDSINTLSNGHEIPSMTMLFHAESWSGEPTPDPGEIADLGWFARDALPRMPERTRCCIHAYSEFVRTGAFQLV